MLNKLNFIFALTFALFLLSASAIACTCERGKIKIKGFSGQIVMRTAPDVKEPLPNAIIKLIEQTSNGDKIIAEVLSDENGHFAVADVKSGNYILEAMAKNFQKLTTEIKIIKGSSRKKELEIGLEVADICCSGWATVRKTI